MTNGSSGSTGDPYQMLGGRQARLSGVRERAQQAQAQMAENRVTERSADGAVELSVNAGGQLDALRLGPKAEGKTMLQLSEAIMATYRKASASVAARTLNIMADLAGEESVTVSTMKANLSPELASEVEDIRREEGRVL